MQDVFDRIEAHELTPDLQMLASSCGIETVRKLLREFGGLSFYIPKLTRLDDFVFRYIRENSDIPVKISALQLGVSEQFLRNLERKRQRAFANRK